MFPLMTPFFNLALKIETSRVKETLTPFWKLEMPMMLLCMFGLFILV